MLLIRKSVSKTQQHKTDTELSMCVSRVISENGRDKIKLLLKNGRDEIKLLLKSGRNEIKSFLKNDRNEDECVKGE